MLWYEDEKLWQESETMNKHTAGPWNVQICKGSYQRPALIVAGKKMVASCLGDQLEPKATSIGEAEANAHLISAAPDLLSSLEEMVADLISHASLGLNEQEIAMLRRAEAAIAKARGK